CQQFNISPPTF
nr:immunoglobulin light chain junction region [Macaca mulatta]